MSDVAVRHAVGFPDQLLIRHSLEVSPSLVTIAKEARNCIIAITAAWTIVSIVKQFRSSPR